MNYIATNALPIGAATLAGLVVGLLVHAVLGRPVAGRPGAAFAVTAIVAEAWLASILAGALILAPAAGPGPWVMALASAGVIWIGFVLPTTLVTGLHAGLSPARVAGYALHWLLVMLVQAATLQAVGLAKPG